MDYNFLDLVQMVARESGTIADALPQTTTGQTGRVGKIVHWTNEAWTRIQNRHSSWRWMLDEFEADIEPGMFRYSSIQMGIERFGRWVTLSNTLSMYATDIGKSDEGFLYPIYYRQFRRLYDIGEQEPSRPACFSIAENNLLCFGPVPDKVYRVRGQYYKSAQELINDGDIPELPLRFRRIIAWYALVLLSKHDEGGFAVMSAQQEYNAYLGDLEADQLPNVEIYSRLV